jgi:flagellar basal body-associated protein FliL
MAKEVPAPSETAPESAEAAPAPAKSSLLGKIKILAFVLLVIVVECVVAYLYLPSASAAAAMAGATLATPSKAEETAEKEKADKSDPEDEAADQVEVDLGQFNVTAFQPTTNTTLRIDLHLFGTVGAKDGKDFVKLKEENQHRFRDQVIVIIRSADITDLTDPGLNLMKRKILEKTNRMFGKPLLRAVIFSDFSFIEQ